MPITIEDRELLRRMELAQELRFLHPRDAVIIVAYSDSPETALRELADSGRLPMKAAEIKPDPPRFYL